MTTLSNRLNTDGEIPGLQQPDDPDNPTLEEAPFPLDEARPLSRQIGDMLASGSFHNEGTNPDIAIEHRRNPELFVWIVHFSTSQGETYILSCWGLEHQMYFEVPRETAQDVLRQAIDSHIWRVAMNSEDIIDGAISNL